MGVMLKWNWCVQKPEKLAIGVFLCIVSISFTASVTCFEHVGLLNGHPAGGGLARCWLIITALVIYPVCLGHPFVNQVILRVAGIMASTDIDHTI